MKKVLSILMVAVLSLNLLYQPCVATNDKKEAVSSVTQESISVGEQSEKPSGNGIKAKTEASQSKAAEKSKPKESILEKGLVVTRKVITGVFLSILSSIYFVLLLCALGAGYMYGRHEDAYKKGYEEGFRSGRIEGLMFNLDNSQRAVIDKYCEAKQTDVVFPIDKMSKKCLKQMVAYLHPDKFECYEDIRNFYVKAQEAYEKMK